MLNSDTKLKICHCSKCQNSLDCCFGNILFQGHWWYLSIYAMIYFFCPFKLEIIWCWLPKSVYFISHIWQAQAITKPTLIVPFNCFRLWVRALWHSIDDLSLFRFTLYLQITWNRWNETPSERGTKSRCLVLLEGCPFFPLGNYLKLMTQWLLSF